MRRPRRCEIDNGHGRHKEHRKECERGGNCSNAWAAEVIRHGWILRLIDMETPVCCACCAAAEVRRVRKRAMKEDAQAEARMAVSRAAEQEITPAGGAGR